MTNHTARPRSGQIDSVRLRAIRESQELSQAEFAMLVRKAGAELGEPNSCNKRLIQKWESGDHSTCRPNYRRALARVTGMTFAQLCAPLATPAAMRPVTGSVPGSEGLVVDAPSPIADGVALRVLLDSVIGQLAAVRERLGVEEHADL